jgi:hypothetical protein
MNRFLEYGQAVKYANRTCYINKKRSFFDNNNGKKVTMFQVISRHFAAWVESGELKTI